MSATTYSPALQSKVYSLCSAREKLVLDAAAQGILDSPVRGNVSSHVVAEFETMCAYIAPIMRWLPEHRERIRLFRAQLQIIAAECGITEE